MFLGMETAPSHRRKHRGGTDVSPQNLHWGDANVIRPPRFWSLRHVLCNEYDRLACSEQTAARFQASYRDFPPASMAL